MTLSEIMELARAYARARDALEGMLGEIEAERRAALARRRRPLEARVAKARSAKEALMDAVGASRHLFARPRTQVVDGIKFGLRKQQGRLDIPDEARTISLIRRLMPRRQTQLIKVSEAVKKPSLRSLAAAELAAIGVNLTHAADAVEVTEPRNDLDRLVEALLGEGEEG